MWDCNCPAGCPRTLGVTGSWVNVCWGGKPTDPYTLGESVLSNSPVVVPIRLDPPVSHGGNQTGQPLHVISIYIYSSAYRHGALKYRVKKPLSAHIGVRQFLVWWVSTFWGSIFRPCILHVLTEATLLCSCSYTVLFAKLKSTIRRMEFELALKVHSVNDPLLYCAH